MLFEEYTELMDSGYRGAEVVAPEDEFFHSIYISGKTRKNHIGVEEQTGKFQIRGVQYNLDEVHMVITHVKDVLLNVQQKQGKDQVVCFSFKKGSPPWYGTSTLPDGSPRSCPQTSAERAANSFCNTCKSQIIVAGIYCKEDGSPVLTEDKKPIFVFLRARGMKYRNVADYLNELYKEDLSPIFTPVTEQSKMFEKTVVNHKRFVTKITKGQETSSYGNVVNVFVLERGVELPKDTVLSILKLSKQTFEKFNDKFDWSKRKQVTGYETPEGVLTVDEPETKPENEKQESGLQEQVFSFDDIDF